MIYIDTEERCALVFIHGSVEGTGGDTAGFGETGG